MVSFERIGLANLFRFRIKLDAKRCFPQTAAQAWPRATGRQRRALSEITHQRPAPALGKCRIPGSVAILLRFCVKRGLKPWDVL